MYSAFINIILGFLEGFALILSPCILPILPIILSGSLTGSKRRPLGILLGFIAAFTIVTVFTRFVTQAAHVNPEIVRIVSLSSLLLVGVIMMSTYLSEKFTLLTQPLAQIGLDNRLIDTSKSGFFSGFIFGCLVGVIWTPCAGPILAAVIVQVIIQKTTLGSVLVVIAFAIGAGLPMLFIALIGRGAMQHFSFFRTHTYLIRKILGVVIILSVLFLYFNPTIGIETETISSTEVKGNHLISPVPQPFPAPPIQGIDAWINSPPLTIADLKGKVVLIDFWTYSCINCLRTLPYLRSWYAKYHNKDLVIIGVHSPEFVFEHSLQNVKNAVAKNGILYPVALDNQFVTWRNYYNRYWPAHYLIDKNGYVVYIHFGEGEYNITENNIRYLLGLNQKKIVQENTQDNPDQTPETYLGYTRVENYASPEGLGREYIQTYHFPSLLNKGQWALQGDWLVQAQKIIAQSSGAGLRLHFNASHVYAVMGVQNQSVQVKILLNGRRIANGTLPNVVDSQVTVNAHQLYELLSFQIPVDGVLDIVTSAPGLEVYTFTFG